MPTTRDYYEVLSVERTADSEEIKRAYRRLAMKYHPDRNPGDIDAETCFKECAEAYEVLSNDQTRARYDQFGHEALRGSGAAAHDFSRMDVSDIFSMFEDIFSGGGFGSGRRGRRSRGGVARGFDLETEVILTFEDVLAGCERNVEFTRLDVCRTCAGSGAKPGTRPETCTTCQGHGKVQQAGLGGMFRMVTACPHCGGRGTVIKERCSDCSGRGRKPRKRTLSVKIPPGVQDGQAVRVAGEGEPPAPDVSSNGDGVRGDLHVVVRVADHPMFTRQRDHLIIELPISFSQATLGAQIEVPTLDGPHDLTIPKGTQHGAIFKIHGQGLPHLRSGRRGDLVIACRIEIPRKLTSEQEHLLREFAKTEDEQVLPESHGFFKKIKDFLGGSTRQPDRDKP